ncbi:YciI family protein [Paludibacterium paludis]|uniref:YCII-related domain-containing protein n=1 Tax=Paludibacterium paludis TaxID=1225769 RepID=A0A918NYC6_9NEIS|nr:YciI family protein [Paludibacterium paludis]GGY05136.1 hypothetical protein GCM10011289_04630 [Paludibacterium paludis]
MYIVELTYLKPLADIETHLEVHRRYLDEEYASGLFLASGPKVPREGGVILASGGVSRQDLESALSRDPFRRHGLAEYRVTESTPVKTHPAVRDILS